MLQICRYTEHYSRREDVREEVLDALPLHLDLLLAAGRDLLQALAVFLHQHHHTVHEPEGAATPDLLS